MSIVNIALKSLYNRKVTALLTVISISISVMLLLGVEKVRKGAETSFNTTISGTDLIVGARAGDIQLLLYSVFRMGDAPNNMSWESYQEIKKNRDIAWTIPMSLGDSHKGFKVLGTNEDYFKYYRFGNGKKISFQQGDKFDDVFDAVIGSEVARELNYELDEKVVLTHGLGKGAVLEHADKPFRVVGVLERTGTPIDKTIHISLEGIEAIHVDWHTGGPPKKGEEVSAEKVREMDLTPVSITAFQVGLKSKFGIFNMQREINKYEDEALMAILPGVTLQRLWETFNVADKALKIISSFVVSSGLMVMLAVILTTLNERRREMAILRSVGAKPSHIFFLMISEAVSLSILGVLSGIVAINTLLFFLKPVLERKMGLLIHVWDFSIYEVSVVGGIVILGFLVGCIPAWIAYRNSMSDGLTIRL